MTSDILFYISGHGFGHAARTMEVIRALWRLRPDLRVAIRSPLESWLFDFTLDGPYTVGHARLDVGAVQSDSLTLDVEATLRAYADIARRSEELIQQEVAATTPLKPRLVFADIPALAFDIAARLDVPSVAMTNFSWDWIYADYVRDYPQYEWLVDQLRASYGRASLLLRLPMYGDLSAFRTVRDIPLVARQATLNGDEVRRRLGLPGDQRLVLLSFGGIGVAVDRPPDLPPSTLCLATQAAHDTSEPPRGLRRVLNAELTAADVRYEDLVAACNAVVTKPGYGIVAECIANATPIVYTSRGRFAEYPFLVAGIEDHLPNAFIDNDDLYAGRWREALESVFAQPRRPRSAHIDGADVAAAAILDLMK